MVLNICIKHYLKLSGLYSVDIRSDLYVSDAAKKAKFNEKAWNNLLLHGLY